MGSRINHVSKIWGSDITLKNLEVHQVTRITPKAWHAYNKKFLHRCLDNLMCYKTYRRNILKMLQYSLWFARLNKTKDFSCRTDGPEAMQVSAQFGFL